MSFNIAIANALDNIVKPPISSQVNATSTAAATSIQIILSTVTSSSNLNYAAKVIQICAQTQAAISDKTSSAYTSMTQACTSIQSTTCASDAQKLASITNSANSAVASLLTTTVMLVQLKHKMPQSKHLLM